MQLKGLFLASFILISILGISQESISLNKLEKNKTGIYIHSQSGKPYSGKAFREYETGTIGMSGLLSNGQFNGLWTWWYADGSKKRETTYVNGVKNGYSHWWYKNGIMKSEIKFADNRNVEQKLWDKKGNRLPNPKMGRR